MQKVKTLRTASVSSKKIDDFVSKLINTSVTGIIKKLDLQKPQFKKTAAYGHFGREEFGWEKIIMLQ